MKLKTKTADKSAQNKMPSLKMPKTLPALCNLYSRLFKRLGREQGCRVKSVGVYRYNKPPKKIIAMKQVIGLLWRLIHTPLESEDAVLDYYRL